MCDTILLLEDRRWSLEKRRGKLTLCGNPVILTATCSSKNASLPNTWTRLQPYTALPQESLSLRMPYDLEKRILAMLATGPLSWRAIAGRIYDGADGLNAGVDAKRTNSALKALQDKDRIEATMFPLAKGRREPTLIYSMRLMTMEQKRRFRSLLAAKDRLLAAPDLKAAGESYVRALLTFSGRFTVEHLVKAPHSQLLSGRHEIDLIATARHPDATMRLVIEVKNQFEPFDSGAAEFGTLLRKALAAKGIPVFAASFLNASGIKLCRRLGIATIEFRRQFLPAVGRAAGKPSPMAELRRLNSVIYPDLFELVAKRPFQNAMSPAAERDYNRIQGHPWIGKAASQWRETAPIIKKHLRDQKVGNLKWTQTRDLIMESLQNYGLL